MIDVENKVKIYEMDGDDYCSIGDDKEKLLVKNHWNNHHMVVLKLGDKKITVCAKELRTAIENSTNTARF